MIRAVYKRQTLNGLGPQELTMTFPGELLNFESMDRAAQTKHGQNIRRVASWIVPDIGIPMSAPTAK